MHDEVSRRAVAVMGGGPSGLMAAEVLAAGGARVTVYDRMPSLGRKFLLAGRGGLNLTHGEAFEPFVGRYGAASDHLRRAVEEFPPVALRAWCEGLGEPTFVGSSGRVFPHSFKTSPLLRAWLRRLDAAGVVFRPRHRWRGWGPDGRLQVDTPEGSLDLETDAAVLALGGASWPQLGSDGAWLEPLRRGGIATAPLRPSNCGIEVAWSRMFRERFEGSPLKGAGFGFGETSLRGEAVVTREGLEGGAIYALSPLLREAVERHGKATLRIALRPQFSRDDLARRLQNRPVKQSLSTFLSKALKLSPVATGLLQEAAIGAGERLSDLPAAQLAARIDAVPVRLVGMAPLARAISTAGGVMFEALDDHLMLRRREGCFLAGEMLDWEAPTGGYLLQACFATGALAARGALAWLARDAPRGASAAAGAASLA